MESRLSRILRFEDDVLAAHLYNLLLLCWHSQCIPPRPENLTLYKNDVTVTLYKSKAAGKLAMITVGLPSS